MRRILVAILTLAALVAPVTAQADYTLGTTECGKINFGDRWANLYLNNPASSFAGSLIKYVSTYIQMASTCTGDQVVVRNTGNTAWECRSLPAVVGDITGVSVAAGGGLTGGGSTGNVTVGLLTTCSDNQILKWDTAGSSWGCEADVDTDTTYSARAGFGVEFSGTTIGLLSTCADGQVLKSAGTGTSWACADDTDTNSGGTITGATASMGLAVSSTTLGLLSSCSDGQVLKSGGTGTSWTCANDIDTDTTYSDMVGDSGSGGTHGLAPAPGAGDAAAGKYLSAGGTWSVPGAKVCGAATASTTIGSTTWTRVAGSDGLVAVTGSSTRTGDLTVEITVTGEADDACRFQWKYRDEALNGLDLACATTGTTIASGVLVTFANGEAGGVDSFSDGDTAVQAVSLAATINAPCGILTADLTTADGGKSDVVTINSSSITATSVPILGPIAKGTATTGQLLITGWSVGSGTMSVDIGSFDGTCDGTVKIPFDVPGNTP